MVVMNRIRVSKRVEKKLAKGLVLLEASDLENVNLKDQEVEVHSQDGTFLGTAYLSQQNKGLGWLVSKDKVTFNQAFFETLFRKAKEKRKAYYQDDLTTAFRLFNQEGDGFGGLTVDLYGDYAVFSWYNSYVYQIRQTISEAFRQVFPEVLGAYEKIRFKGLDYESAHVYGQEAPDFFTVLENGVLYQVFMNDGLMTGIFLDQHEVRGSLVDGLAMGKSLLNMFSYTAAFSVSAAMGGASQTTSVDLAKRSRELSQAHFQANGISTDDHRFVVMDVFEYFKYAKRKGLTYDVIVLDPPSFARNKKQTFSVAKDYHKLISQSLEILNPGGIIIASTNAANVSRQKFTEQIDKGFAGRSYQILNKYGLPADFAYNKKDESSNYLKVISMKVSK
ncbi:class I SAM-dependent rRNA methyltransferase [Streptococcus mitis]|uniref:Class I SAM-dependent rRNA methyltransferase n=2 Tax=Streptococcus mitis TaxID=28037 RepID=A0A6L5H3S7_STRMT|nr:class I SAM-dependent rRNA methyltransferase [Streptococcus mitis]MQP69082.1 class I SAM-dependent rRNA methyltransferase [Streptococcus mitis]MQP70905.1 class I SAM-dependent rRNA methyltransferase [Streptococcus mitis]MQP87532.1 class I SAM-dependent rRNA methyltransferase [Streptococcus mitis]MQP88319.1 class I SAM-dependent rRNA methyltransferase [Streptococcus mitis]